MTDDFGTPKGQEISPEKLAKYGYANMHEFSNWRWFKKYAGGPISDLGAHQIDMFNWMYETTPLSVMATGGVDYYDGTGTATTPPQNIYTKNAGKTENIPGLIGKK